MQTLPDAILFLFNAADSIDALAVCAEMASTSRTLPAGSPMSFNDSVPIGGTLTTPSKDIARQVFAAQGTVCR